MRKSFATFTPLGPFIVTADEDFGITAVEAQACGTPVIAYGRGGSLETVVAGTTGVFFTRQTAESIADAVDCFSKISDSFEPEAIRANTDRFTEAQFDKAFRTAFEVAWDDFQARGPGNHACRSLSGPTFA